MLLVNQHVVPIFIDIANAFAKSGKQVTLFTGCIEPGGKPLLPSVRLVDSIPYNRKSSTTRFLSWIGFTVHCFLYLISCKRHDKILVTTNPPTSVLISAWVAWIRSIPFFILVYDLYPEALYQAGFTSTRGFVYRFWEKLNKWAFPKATAIFTLSDSMKNAISKYAPKEKIHVIYNWADLDYIRPIPREKNEFIDSYKLQDKFVVMYSGNMGLTHDLESLVEAAALLREEKGVFFVLIGTGAKKQKLETLQRENGLTNVIFLPYQQKEKFPISVAAADIAIVTLDAGADGISVPSKTYINMAAGACILAISPANSELNRIVLKYNVGVTCEPQKPAQLAETIKILMTNPDLVKTYKENSRRSSFNFTPENAQEYVKTIYPTLLN
jgi:glycosyltransferase involved in cell wall biosynthesis